ncbi:hypothetical protein [Nitrosococcus wardiae]|uniref:Uncharacterized protein n=1 Tax=Nitrosococcus wardiae TaxID=1814290 RepID=A0A4P7BWV3_9GAMM|nr:hypothetical protein [Nitrosococcus wardiae]QBQ53709.1 hypothetical protein E3U44_03675 [Nitrosococcus wardiae]
MGLRLMSCGFVLATIMLVTSAQAVMVTGAFTGAWFDKDAPGQGFLLQVVDRKGTDTAIVYWFTFNAFGNQNWLLGQAPVKGAQVDFTMHSVEGGILDLNGFDPARITLQPWGHLVLQFEDCNHGTARYEALDPQISDGQFKITRLTKSLGDECSGGLSDNTPPSTDAKIIRVDFDNTGVIPQATARMKFEQNRNHAKFKIWVKDLPADQYELLVGNEIVGVINARGQGQNTLFFRSPETCNWELLDFDPLNQIIKIAQGDKVFMTAFLSNDLASFDDGDDRDEDGDGDRDDGSCDEDG